MVAAVAWIVAAVIFEPSGAGAAAAAPVEVAGTAACPAAADVASALEGLIGPTDPGLGADRATLTDDGASVTVALSRASGEPVGEKQLDGALSCEQRARAAAVIIAAWEARLGVQTTPLVVEPREPPAPAAVVTTPAPAPAAPATRVEPGVGVGASMNGTTLAPVATVDVAFTRPGAFLIPSVAALVVGSHGKAVGPGDGTWRRYGLVASLGSRTTWSAVALEARVGVAATLLDISGNSYPNNGAGITFDPGVPIGARFGVRTRPVRWWVDATVAFWPRPQTLYVAGAPGSATLPRAEALLAVGASYEGR